MRIYSLYIILFSSLIFSCNSTKEDKESCSKLETSNESSKSKDLVMYDMSELASLMEQMYVDNKRLKERIEKGEDVGEFPEYFAKIHTAVMTDASDNDAFFQEQAKNFIASQKLIYSEPEKAKEHYSNAIQACINCHEMKCSGPIPRIKKLELKNS